MKAHSQYLWYKSVNETYGHIPGFKKWVADIYYKSGKLDRAILDNGFFPKHIVDKLVFQPQGYKPAKFKYLEWYTDELKVTPPPKFYKAISDFDCEFCKFEDSLFFENRKLFTIHYQYDKGKLMNERSYSNQKTFIHYFENESLAKDILDQLGKSKNYVALVLCDKRSPFFGKGPMIELKKRMFEFSTNIISDQTTLYLVTITDKKFLFTNPLKAKICQPILLNKEVGKWLHYNQILEDLYKTKFDLFDIKLGLDKIRKDFQEDKKEYDFKKPVYVSQDGGLMSFYKRKVLPFGDYKASLDWFLFRDNVPNKVIAFFQKHIKAELANPLNHNNLGIPWDFDFPKDTTVFAYMTRPTDYKKWVWVTDLAFDFMTEFNQRAFYRVKTRYTKKDLMIITNLDINFDDLLW